MFCIASILVMLVCLILLVIGWMIAQWWGLLVAFIICIIIWDAVLHSLDEG